jgi:hypothetical protein
MRGRWRRGVENSPGSEEEPEPVMHGVQETRPEPTTDDLASVLALVIVSDLNAEQIRERTGISSDGAEAAIARLQDRDIVRDSGGGYFQASQVSCAGSCLRKGHELRGQEVVIDAKSFRWSCAACWDAEVGRRRSLGRSGDGA